MVVQVTLPGIDNLGWKFWIIWAGICFAFIYITYLFYPEAANRTLEDIDQFFESEPGIFINWNKTAVQLRRPIKYIEADERIAREDIRFTDKEKEESIGIEHLEAKEDA